MAKQIHEIKGFHDGLNTSASSVDTPDDTSISSFNTNSKSKFGRLSPTYKDSISNRLFIASDMIFIKDKTKGHILIGFQTDPDSSGTFEKLGWLKTIENFYEEEI